MNEPALQAPREEWQDYMVEQASILLTRATDDGYSLTEQDGRDYLIDLAIDWEFSNVHRGNDLFIRRFFWPEIKRFAQVSPEEWDAITSHTEAVFEARKKAKHDFILRKALVVANEHIQFDRFDLAKTCVAEAAIEAEEVLAEKPSEPVISVSDSISMLRQDLLGTQGVRYVGLCQHAIPDLDDATGGFRGLMLVGGKSGAGKTTLVAQNVLDILRNNQNTCAVFFSLDMLRLVLLRRMASHCAGLSLTALRTGSGDTGWTPEEEARVNEGLTELRRLGSRIKILDRFSFPYLTRRDIIQQIARLMEETQSEHCVSVLDLLELLPAPAHFKQEYDQDAWRIDQVRTISDNLGEDPFIAVCESGKGEKADNDIIKGNSRKVQRSDMVIKLAPFADEDLLAVYDLNNDYPILRQKREPYKEKDAKQRATDIRKALKAQGKAPTIIEIGKGRDGALCTDFNVINHFHENKFTPLRGR